MTKNKTSKASLIAMIILTIVIIVGAVGGIAYATNGLTTDLRGFDVLQDGKIIDGKTFELRNDKTPIEFEIRAKTPNLDISGITCKVTANSNSSNVNVTADSEIFSLTNCNDYARLFDIKIENEKVTISTEWKLIEFLANYYNVSFEKIKLDGFEYGKKAYFDLNFIIGKVKVSCSMIDYITIADIQLNENSILLDKE